MTANAQYWQLNKPSAEAGETGEKHTPVITVDGNCAPGNTVQVTVDVGQGKHPNEAKHFIQWVELQANGLFIARAEFTAGITKPIATFNVVIPNEGSITLTAIERCNLHGLWESEPVKLS
jgi:desulfoferrodoxin-like iron-binding protein